MKDNTINTNIAVGVGNVFAVVPMDAVKGIALANTHTIVSYNGISYPLYKGTTFEESQKVDKLLDSEKYEENKMSKTKPTKTYDITFARFGYANIEATSADEAFKIANNLLTNEISWNDDWEVTDVMEVE